MVIFSGCPPTWVHSSTPAAFRFISNVASATRWIQRPSLRRCLTIYSTCDKLAQSASTDTPGIYEISHSLPQFPRFEQTRRDAARAEIFTAPCSEPPTVGRVYIQIGRCAGGSVTLGKPCRDLQSLTAAREILQRCAWKPGNARATTPPQMSHRGLRDLSDLSQHGEV